MGLEGQLIHDLLKIFVFEKLEAYIKFFEANKDFVTGLGLKHEDNVRKMKLVRAKIAQGDNMVHVSSTMHRTFGPGDWQQLHQLLTQWKSNIHTVKEQMQHVASAQVDLMHKKI